MEFFGIQDPGAINVDREDEEEEEEEEEGEIITVSVQGEDDRGIDLEAAALPAMILMKGIEEFIGL